MSLLQVFHSVATGSYRRWHNCTAALVVASLVAASSALGGEKLLPPDPSAPPVRILLIVPYDSGTLTRQVSRLHRELADSRGFLLRARSLDEADLVLEFTRYRATVDDKGVNQDWWDGQFRLLTPAGPGVQLAAGSPTRFCLLVIGRESWEIEPVVDLLARTLAKALGRQVKAEGGESV